MKEILEITLPSYIVLWKSQNYYTTKLFILVNNVVWLKLCLYVLNGIYSHLFYLHVVSVLLLKATTTMVKYKYKLTFSFKETTQFSWGFTVMIVNFKSTITKVHDFNFFYFLAPCYYLNVKYTTTGFCVAVDNVGGRSCRTCRNRADLADMGHWTQDRKVNSPCIPGCDFSFCSACKAQRCEVSLTAAPIAKHWAAPVNMPSSTWCTESLQNCAPK